MRKVFGRTWRRKKKGFPQEARAVSKQSMPVEGRNAANKTVVVARAVGSVVQVGGGRDVKVQCFAPVF